MSPLEIFFRDCIAGLKRIVRHSRGEVSLDDVKNEAWVMTEELAIAGRPLDLSCPDDQDSMIRRLYSKFVKRLKTRIGMALRLDRNWDRNDGEAGTGLAGTLVASEASDPSLALERREDPNPLELAQTSSYSQATAYAICLSRWPDFNSLAEYLGIEVGTLSDRIRRWRAWVRLQPSLFDGIEYIALDFIPLPGQRKYSVSSMYVESQQHPLRF